MGKKLLYGAAAAGTLAAVFFSGAFPARADGAVVIKDGGCTFLDGNGGSVAASSDQAVLASNPSGNSKLTCRGSVAPSLTSKGAVHWNFSNTGLLCFTNFGATTDWHEVVTPSGQATLSCHVNPNPTP